MTRPIARLTQDFLSRVESTGLSDAATAAAIGVTPQFYSQVKAGQAAPSTRFIAGAVLAGLAPDFAGVAEAVRSELTAA